MALNGRRSPRPHAPKRYHRDAAGLSIEYWNSTGTNEPELTDRPTAVDVAAVLGNCAVAAVRRVVQGHQLVYLHAHKRLGRAICLGRLHPARPRFHFSVYVHRPSLLLRAVLVHDSTRAVDARKPHHRRESITLRVGEPQTFQDVSNDRSGWQQIAQVMHARVNALSEPGRRVANSTSSTG